MFASFNGYMAIVQMLLEAGAEDNVQNTVSGVVASIST